jgi:hypothetical protein
MVRKGQTVYVHPRLTTDPYNLRGRRCHVLKVEKGVAKVTCAGLKKPALYDVDALLTVKEFKKKLY